MFSNAKADVLKECLKQRYSTVPQLNPGNSNCQGKLKLLRVIEVSSFRGFEQKDQKHLLKWF